LTPIPSAESTASNLGRLEAGDFDERLRAAERRELLGRLQLTPPIPLRAPTTHHDPVRPERFESFYHAVVGSRSWRILQALRRPFGRAW
jgi:hypothetical protein